MSLFSLHKRDIMLIYHKISAKELEHYQRVRATFEGPAKSTALLAPKSTSLPTRTSHTSNPGAYHLQPSTATSRKHPKMNRSNTAKKNDINGKGKGKATEWNSDSDDDDDAYITSNDSMGTPDRKTNGYFGNGTADDDEDMYQ